MLEEGGGGRDEKTIPCSISLSGECQAASGGSAWSDV